MGSNSMKEKRRKRKYAEAHRALRKSIMGKDKFLEENRMQQRKSRAKTADSLVGEKLEEVVEEEKEKLEEAVEEELVVTMELEDLGDKLYSECEEVRSHQEVVSRLEGKLEALEAVFRLKLEEFGKLELAQKEVVQAFQIENNYIKVKLEESKNNAIHQTAVQSKVEAKLKSKITALVREKEKMLQELEQLKTEVAAKCHSVEAKQDCIDDLKDEMKILLTKIRNIEAGKSCVKTKLEESEKNVVQLNVKLAAAEQELGTAQAKKQEGLINLKEELDKRKEELAGIERRMDEDWRCQQAKQQMQLEDLKKERDCLHVENRAVTSQYSYMVAEKGRLQTLHDALQESNKELERKSKEGFLNTGNPEIEKLKEDKELLERRVIWVGESMKQMKEQQCKFKMELMAARAKELKFVENTSQQGKELEGVKESYRVLLEELGKTKEDLAKALRREDVNSDLEDSPPELCKPCLMW